jgi:predicted DNA-binding transcriptional regulator AlpA
MNTIQGDITGRGAFSIEEFCQLHGISRATFYNLKKNGQGPKEMRIGSRRLISIEAAADWRRLMEVEAT